MKPSFHADAVAAALSHASPIPGTPEVILGPFYTADREAPHTLDLTGRSGEVAGAAGQHILVNIAIVDEDGHALEGVRAEFCRPTRWAATGTTSIRDRCPWTRTSMDSAAR